ncbi:SDR family oxidoreductase [Aureispira anguillae]|uniref:SDR family NAD(P)-dependent oxidoreductase n=1 Tax=Aureispira anguillae TaxID=2864201 RepID=A0A915YK13_9BACT|nr:SDR family NAD(P)-dependent oxidoreductase [Aureispira anguillae]BDS14238.1 SDR family NAD(P)-dependent oxidoreductase [Aureispira anguillae]
MKLSSNKILITGATSGIGLALLEAFLAYDNQIIALGRNEERLKKLAQRTPKIIPFCCDISNTEDLDQLVFFIEQEHKDLNILINNAGIQYNYHFQENPQISAQITQEINVNFIAPVQLIALLLPTLHSNKNAAIVNVSSGLGLVPKMTAPVYCATKAAIHIFSQSLRYQLSAIKVFEIIPPLVETPMTAGRGKGKISPQQLADEFMQALKKDKLTVNIGKVKWLKLINRVCPRFAQKIMKGSFS